MTDVCMCLPVTMRILGDDMVSIKGDVEHVPMSVEAFGSPDPEERDTAAVYVDCYTEGPWVYKRDGRYYMLYAAGGVPEHIDYSMADSPMGPWRYMGVIMPLKDTGSFTNHCGVADFRGKSYFAYHTGKLPGGSGFGRSAAIEEFVYNPDGTFPIINPTEGGPKPIKVFDPYRRVEAETMAFSKGVKTEPTNYGGVYVSDIHNGDYIKVANVDFGPNENQADITVSAASALRGGEIEMRLDSISGYKIATIKIDNTCGWVEWQTFSSSIAPTKGIHDLYLVFSGRKGPKLFNLDWWQLSPQKTPE